MINFRKLTLQNFLSYGAKQEFVFESSGIHLIKGENADLDSVLSEDTEISASNGSGKSGLGVALRYVLKGNAWKRRKIPKERIPHKKYKKNSEVTLELDIDKKDIYLIKRYQKFDKLGNALLFYKWDEAKSDWIDLTKSEMSITQELIDSIIQISEPTITKSILFARDDLDEILDLNITQKGEVFENVIQLSKLKKYFDKSKDKLKENEKKQIELNAAVRELDNNKLKFKNLIIDEITDIKTRRETCALSIKQVDERIKKLDVDIDTVVDEINRFLENQKQKKSVDADYVQTANLYNAEAKNKKTLFDNLKKSKTLLADAESELKKLKPDVCENCGHTQHEKDFKEQESKLKKQITNLSAVVDSSKAQLQKSVDDMKAIDDRLAVLNIEIQRLEAETFNLNENIKKVLINNDSGAQAIKEELSVLKATKQTSIDKLNAIDTTNIKRLLEMWRIESRERIKRLQIASGVKKNIELLQFWTNVLDVKNDKSIKQFVVAKIIPVFNNILNDIVVEIFDNKLIIFFDTFFNETIVYNNEEYTYGELSTGERYKLNLCINLALFNLTRLNYNGSNIIWMDEVFTSIDESAIVKFIKIIEKLYSKDAAIYIISHSKGVENITPSSRILIRKEEGESKIIVTT